jgi:hypothetical protein
MKELNFRRVAVDDLAKHFDERVTTMLEDFMDRCHTLDIEYERATAMAITVLSHHLTCAALGVDANEKEFVGMCLFNYRKVKERLDVARDKQLKDYNA